MSSFRKEFMQAAIDMAMDNIKTGKGGPFGAVIVKEGKIIAKGSNLVTSTNDPTAHAEVVAIRNACKALNSFQLDDCEIYTSCEPCPMCLGAIYWARPKKIYFACNKKDAAHANFDDSFIYDEIPLPIEERNIPTEQYMRKESLEVFEKWIEAENKIEY